MEDRDRADSVLMSLFFATLKGERMLGRVGCNVLSAALLIIVGACASSEPASKGPVVTSEDLWRLSGTREALVELHHALSDACQAKLETPDDLLTLPAGQAVCVRSRLVEAFDADAGASPCSQGRDLRQFVSCILEGQFVGNVIENSGSAALPADVQWGSRDARGQRASKLISDRIHASCLTPSKSAMQECVETSMFRYFEVKPEAIDFCPAKEQRDMCIYWAGFAHSIRLKLDRVHS